VALEVASIGSQAQSGTQRDGNQEHNAQLVAQIEPKSDNSGRCAEFFTRSINRLPSIIHLSPCSSRIEECTARHASVLIFLCKHTTEDDKNMSAVQKIGVSHSKHEIISTSGTLYRSYTRVRNPSGILADMATGIQILCFPSTCSGSPEAHQCEYWSRHWSIVGSTSEFSHCSISYCWLPLKTKTSDARCTNSTKVKELAAKSSVRGSLKHRRMTDQWI
jgi:hypothetical protein